MIVYLIGPSGGYFDGNRKGFAAVAAALRKQGLSVIDPREIAERFDDPRVAVSAMFDADALVLLPGWKSEVHPRLLAALADNLGMSLLDYPSLQPEKPCPVIELPDTKDHQNTREQNQLPRSSRGTPQSSL